jgi:hypothetical protein
LPSERVERRLAAVLAADVAGYSRLMGRDEERTLAQLKTFRKTLVDPKIATHRGRIVKTTGDGMLVEFASAVDAARCAMEVQREMAGQNADVPQDLRIEFRIGIHVGDIIIDDNDIFGDGVNIAARLEGIAEPGGVCWSAYCGNRDEAVEGVIDADPIAIGVREMMAALSEWTGTAADLLVTLSGAIGERAAKSKTWPDSPRALSGRLRRAATFLRKGGLEINFERKGRAGHRIIHITTAQPFAVPETAGKQPSVPSASSAASPNSVWIDVLSEIDPPTVVDEADDQAGESGRTVSVNPLKPGTPADADGADANSASQSAVHEHNEQACVQCDAAPDGKELLYTVNGKAVRLHPECRRFYSVDCGNCAPEP